MSVSTLISRGSRAPERCDLSARYYNTRGIAASCGNTRYYVLLNDRTIDRHGGDVSIGDALSARDDRDKWRDFEYIVIVFNNPPIPKIG